MNKTLVFDMDGTIADFYGVNTWLTDIRSGNTRPYDNALPLYDMEVVNGLLLLLKGLGWKVVVTSWLAKGSDEDFANRTRTSKKEWLAKYDFPYDEIHLVKYGTTKANCTRNLKGYQILVDDNADIRKGWTLGATINPTNNLVKDLLDILANEC